MARLPAISGDDLVKAVRKIGYVWDHIEGSHMILLHPSGRRLSVPRHKELGRGLSAVKEISNFVRVEA